MCQLYVITSTVPHTVCAVYALLRLKVSAFYANPKYHMNLIQVSNSDVYFRKNRVLHDITMHVDQGEIITIVGPNGSGKTTLLRAIIGAI